MALSSSSQSSAHSITGPVGNVASTASGWGTRKRWARVVLRGSVTGMVVAALCAALTWMGGGVSTVVAGAFVAAGALAGGVGATLQARMGGRMAPEARVRSARSGQHSRQGASPSSATEARPAGPDPREHRLIVETLADVVSRHAVDTTCLFVTPSVESLLGYTPDTLVGRRCIDLVHPDDRSSLKKGIETMLEDADDRRHVRLRRRDGTYVWVEMTSRLQRDADAGEPLHVVTSIREMSRRWAAERAIHKNEVRSRQLAENVDGIFWLATPDDVLYVSPAYERIWGRTVESLYENPSSYIDAIHPDDRTWVRDEIRRSVREHTSFDEKYRVVRPDGSVRWVHSVASPVPVPSDDVREWSSGRTDGRGRFREHGQRHAGYTVDVTEQKEHEEALRQSEDRWRRLVETHMEPILITVRGVIRYINPSGADLFGAQSAEELIGRSIFDFVVESYASDVAERMETLKAGNATLPFENRVRRLDGETRVVESQSVPIRYEGEQAAQTVLRDITEWRDTQGQLEYRVLFDTMIVDLSKQLIDTDADITDVCIERALSRIGPFVGADRSYVFLLDDEDETFSNTHEWVNAGVESQMADMQNVPCSRFPWLMERLKQQRSVRVPDVETLPPEAAAEKTELLDNDVQSLVIVPMDNGRGLMGFVGFDAVGAARIWTNDTVTPLRLLGDTFANAFTRKKVEQTLRERESQYRTVVENVRDVVFKTASDGTWTFLNPAWERVTGFSVGETLGAHCTDMLRGGEVEAVREVLVEGTRSACRCEVKLERRDGEVRWMALFAQSTYDEDGHRSGAAGTLHDITERKRMEQRTRAALRRERELNRLKSSFVSMVSHEFRTPLSTMRSSAEMLMRYFDHWPADKRDKHLTRIHRQIDRMSRLIGDVITTSKLDAQSEAPTLAPLDVRAFLREAVEEAIAATGASNRVETDLDALPDRLDADGDLLRHIAGNLLSNALKYSGEDTVVDLRAYVRGDRLVLRVHDHGIGIPSADLANLFEAFHRAGNVGSTEGSGLGMTIVKRAVDVYGGELTVESVESEGSTFLVKLPIHVDEM